MDKIFGFGFATVAEKSWLNGGSPTLGFLKFATKGPFANFYQSLAGNQIVDWLFMLGLLFIGLTLVLGIMTRMGAVVGIIMLFLFYTAGFIWPVNNPFMDEHLVYIIIMLGIIFADASDYLGFGKKWGSINLVSKFRVLK